MTQLGLETKILNQELVNATIARLKQARVVLPTFSQLQDPSTIPHSIIEMLKDVSPDEAHALNLFRVHWNNDRETGGFTDVPDHVVLPPALTGVDSPIVVLFGDTFPMISAHKVLPAYACLAPRLVTGQFDPGHHRAVWPSTGNYCRGGVAISRILGCHSVAVLPEGMSRERFDWLEEWVVDVDDIIRTPGTESNVKEIYDKCAELDTEERNVIFNQFAEFGNYLSHYLVTGAALEKVFKTIQGATPDLRLAAFVGTTGSAGTIAAGDYLKERFDSKIAAAEPVECPTLSLQRLWRSQYPGHRRQARPLYSQCDEHGFRYRCVGQEFGCTERSFQYCVWPRIPYRAAKVLIPNLRTKHSIAWGYRPTQISSPQSSWPNTRSWAPAMSVVTIATDGGCMYETERQKTLEQDFGGRFDPTRCS